MLRFIGSIFILGSCLAFGVAVYMYHDSRSELADYWPFIAAEVLLGILAIGLGVGLWSSR